MQPKSYTQLAELYDIFVQHKDYGLETEFIAGILESYGVDTVLDVGCGTGNHLVHLERIGFNCTGIDINREMLDIAKTKLKSDVVNADVTRFNLQKRFDAITCMYAVFNHLVDYDSANAAIKCFKKHLEPGGVLILDLCNPIESGSKIECVKGWKRTMSWDYDPISGIEKSKAIFEKLEPDESRAVGDIKSIVESEHVFRIYSVDEISRLLINFGFDIVSTYEGYQHKPISDTSKNLEIIALSND